MVGASSDKDGNREYTLVFRINVDSTTEGPLAAAFCSQLPGVGDGYSFKAERDVYAWRTLEWDAKPVTAKEGDSADTYDVQIKFSTKQPDFCPQDGMVLDPVTGFTYKDPLRIPMEIDIDTIQDKEEATEDRFGDAILNRAWEQIRGPLVEFDRSKLQVRIKQNWHILDLDYITSIMDAVNETTMWGFPPRTVKLSKFGAKKKFIGTGSSTVTGTGTGTTEEVVTCDCYFERTFVFDIDTEGFDRDVASEGTKVIIGHWDLPTNPGTWVIGTLAPVVFTPNVNNPKHFQRATDALGKPIRILHRADGGPAGDASGTGDDTYNIHIEVYEEDNFLHPRLGLPTSLETC